MDSLAGIDYSLMEAPRAAAQMLDVMLKVRVLEQGLGWVLPQRSIRPSGSALSWSLLSAWFSSVLISPASSGVWGGATWSGGECSQSQAPLTRV